MRIGVPKEIRNHEYRVGLVPTGVRELVGEAAAGAGIGVDATTYQAAGAKIIPTA